MNILFAIGISVILLTTFIFIDANVFEFKVKKFKIGFGLSVAKAFLSIVAFFYFVLSSSILRSIIIGVGITIVMVLIFWLVSFFFTGKLFFDKKKKKLDASENFIFLSARVLTTIKNSIVSAALIGITLYKTGILSRL